MVTVERTWTIRYTTQNDSYPDMTDEQYAEYELTLGEGDVAEIFEMQLDREGNNSTMTVNVTVHAS